MRAPQILTGSIALLLFALVILGFGIGPVSASAVQGQYGNSTAVHGHGGGHHFARNSAQRNTMTEAFITKLQNQGVDVSTVQAAFQNNDTTAVNAWFKSYSESHQGSFGNFTHVERGTGFKVNATAQQVHLKSFISKLQSQGVDVSSVQTALQHNDTATVTSWLKSFFEAHPNTMTNSTRPHWHQWNSTASKSS